jgi:hypothetical protein
MSLISFLLLDIVLRLHHKLSKLGDIKRMCHSSKHREHGPETIKFGFNSQLEQVSCESGILRALSEIIIHR